MDWKKKLMDELKGNKELLNLGDEEGESFSGSDDDPSEDNLPESTLLKVVPVKSKIKVEKKEEQKNSKVENQFSQDEEEEEIAEKLLVPEKVIDEKPTVSQQSPILDKRKEKKHTSFRSIVPLQAKITIIQIHPQEIKKEEEHPTTTPPPPLAILMIDAATQTTSIDFQKAKAKFVMNKYGSSSKDSKGYKQISNNKLKYSQDDEIYDPKSTKSQKNNQLDLLSTTGASMDPRKNTQDLLAEARNKGRTSSQFPEKNATMNFSAIIPKIQVTEIGSYQKDKTMRNLPIISGVTSSDNKM
jgi:hypothetical protein